MGDTVIKVENLGKKYIINHQRERYTALRDVIANKVKLVGRKKTDTGEREEFWALKDVSFEIEQGNRVGIIGRNGAGKSTLLKLLSRITEPTTGSIALKGKVSSLLEIGTGFHPELTGRENIYLNGAILGMNRREIKDKFDEIVEFADVEKFLDTPVKRYSSGMYVRLAFSVAAHMEPEILIVDEVLSVGDAQFQKKCLGKMEDVGKQGRTVLFVSHNMGAIQQLCNSVIIINGGRVVDFSNNVVKQINRYLSQETNKKCLWDAANNPSLPDNPWLRVLSFCAKDKNNCIVSEPILSNEELNIEVALDIKKVEPGLQICYIISNEYGIEVFRTYHTDVDEENWPELKIGLMTLRTTLTKLYLNEGTYTAMLEVSIRNREWICNSAGKTPVFSFEIKSGISKSPYWVDKRQSIIAPVIQWESI